MVDYRDSLEETIQDLERLIAIEEDINWSTVSDNSSTASESNTVNASHNVSTTEPNIESTTSGSLPIGDDIASGKGKSIDTSENIKPTTETVNTGTGTEIP